MPRILILGSCGAGKSTFARKLAQKTGLPIIHLDQHYWKTGWVESTKEEWIRKVAALVEAPDWIMDGNYSGSLHLRVPRADTIIFLDYPVWKSLYRVIRRIIRSKLGIEKRADMAPGCPERFDLEFLLYVMHFPKVQKPKTFRILKAHGWEKEDVIVFKAIVILRGIWSISQMVN